MPPAITNLLPPVDEDQIQAFERRNCLTLPADYRQFLLSHNGGMPRPSCSWIPTIRKEVIVDVLYGIADSKDLDLQECIDEFRDEMPKGALIIGSDPGAAMFILGTSPPLVGVYFWDHQHRFTGSSEESGNTFKLAPTFTAWLEKLRDPQEPDQ
jgi:hypothetical protein